jgi:hypothetical protein
MIIFIPIGVHHVFKTKVAIIETSYVGIVDVEYVVMIMVDHIIMIMISLEQEKFDVYDVW